MPFKNYYYLVMKNETKHLVEEIDKKLYFRHYVPNLPIPIRYSKNYQKNQQKEQQMQIPIGG